MNKDSIRLVNEFSTLLKKLIVFATGLSKNTENKHKLERYRALALNAINYDPLSALEIVGSKMFEDKDMIQKGRLDLIMAETLDGKYKDQLLEDKFTAGILELIKKVYDETDEYNKSLIMSQSNDLLDVYIQYLISVK